MIYTRKLSPAGLTASVGGSTPMPALPMQIPSSDHACACEKCANKRKKIYRSRECIADFPHAMEEWMLEKNNKQGLNPYALTAGSNQKAWWKCKKCGYEWQSAISRRMSPATGRSKVSGCPACAGKVVYPGHNDLATIAPEVAAEWHPTENGDLRPCDVTYGSGKKVWWKCSRCGENFQAVIANRTKKHIIGCPSCAVKTRYLVKGKTDLETLYPEIAASWHPTRNGNLRPSDVSPGMNDLLWWICSDCGYEWQASPHQRTASCGRGCPMCAGKVVLRGVNDFGSKHPDMATQWHPTKNGGLTPFDVAEHSHKRVWWECPDCGYEWQTAPHNRLSGSGHACPACAGRAVFPGHNDLKTIRPDIAKEWHPTKNGRLKPSDVLPHSNRKVWWVCEKCGFEWCAQINSRVGNGHGCSACKESFGEKTLRRAVEYVGLENFETQKLIRTARTLKTGGSQYLDGFLKYTALSKPVVFEFQGAQHFRESVTFQASLKETQERDLAKFKECKARGYVVLYFALDTSYVPNVPYHCTVVKKKDLFDTYVKVLLAIKAGDWETVKSYAA